MSKNIICSPYSQINKYSNYSCYTYENLVELKELWNERHPDDLIISDEFDNIYKNQLSSGKTVNESIKKMLDSKNKEAGKILFRDILRILENKRMKNTEITSFFNVRK